LLERERVVKVKFWLLDVNYEVREHSIEIWLWGIDDSGNRVLVIDRNFLAGFYAMVSAKRITIYMV